MTRVLQFLVYLIQHNNTTTSTQHTGHMLHKHLAVKHNCHPLPTSVIIAFDVGNNLAHAVFKDGKLLDSGTFTAQHSKFLTTEEWFAAHIVNVLDVFEKHKHHKDIVVIIEGAGMWGDSIKSGIAAKSGDSFRLAYLVGMLFTQSLHHTNQIAIVSPLEWKGNMSKEVTKARVQLAGYTAKTEHEYDAIGIGLSAQNLL